MTCRQHRCHTRFYHLSSKNSSTSYMRCSNRDSFSLVTCHRIPNSLLVVKEDGSIRMYVDYIDLCKKKSTSRLSFNASHMKLISYRDLSNARNGFSASNLIGTRKIWHCMDGSFQCCPNGGCHQSVQPRRSRLYQEV